MRIVVHIARREWLEQRRQPVMIAAIATLDLLIAGPVLATLAALDFLRGDPVRLETFQALIAPGSDPVAAIDTLAGSALGLLGFLMFTQYLGIASVLAGHAVLHDRQCGTLTFLLLAPVRRLELLLGKVLGAISWATVLYLAIDGTAGLLATAIGVARLHPSWLPLSPGWWVVYGAAAPAWALFIGSICTVISSIARDVRTAQQGVWFVVFFATLGSGGLLTWALNAGVGAALASAALAVAGAGATLFLGAAIRA